MRMRSIFLTVLIPLVVLAANENLSSQSDYKPAVYVTFVNHGFGGFGNSIRKIDFADLPYMIPGKGDSNDGDLFLLRNGKFERRWDFGMREITLKQTYYFRSGIAGPQRALVLLSDLGVGGSSSDIGILSLFQLDSGVLTITQQFQYDEQATGTGVEFNPGAGILIIRARSNDFSPHCCPKSLDAVTFQWTGKQFEEESHRTIPIKAG